MITAHGLTKKFGNITALEQVSFTVALGEFVFLIGPSGSGKTTLLRLILRDLKPDSGTLTVNDQEISNVSTADLPEYRRNIGVVFQDFKLLPDRSIWENIALPLQVRNMKPQQISDSVKVALELVQLSAKTDLFPAQLSGGEVQRVSLARAIVGKPKLLLADEPTGNLDPSTAKNIVKLLKDIHSELKTTVLIATHNADIVNQYSQRVLSVSQGKLVKDAQKGKYE